VQVPMRVSKSLGASLRIARECKDASSAHSQAEQKMHKLA